MGTNEEKQFISMLSDYGFKVSFGNERHTLFLRKALQALISSPVSIQSVQFTRNEMTSITRHSRGGLFDIVCRDEQGRTFTVEMQLVDFKPMIHRAKFYAFHRFNEVVRKGNYRFDDLKDIYTISILAGSTYATELYHQIGTVKNQRGELIDNQITHVIVELGKFHKTAEEIETDLDKLLFTMKTTDIPNRPNILPDFMREGWLEETLAELDRANLTPEERSAYEMAIAGNMTEKYAREDELARAISETEKNVRAETEARVKAETETRIKTETEQTIRKLLGRSVLTDDEIAQDLNVPLSLVEKVKDQIGA